jgi:DNA-binding winged helix-turn-helix (wHTH) protein/TolB-like protein/Tfp pilus assembly protein PilF
MSLKVKSLFEFGPYQLDTVERTLWRDGQMVPLTQKALETLVVLVSNGGRLVEKEDLLKAVWPDTFVEEGNLAVQISLLRKTLGEEGYIETVPRRGYRFAVPVKPVEKAERLPEASSEMPTPVSAEPAWHVTRRGVLTIAVTGVVGGALAAWRSLPTKQPQSVQIRSIAVLPFQMIQPNPGDEWLGLGLADAVITRLAGLNKCIVRPTSAVRQFDQVSRDSVAAGTKLGVEAVLDASIQSAGDRIRLNAQLIRVKDGQHLWTDTFDIRRADLFTLEDELAGRFARSLFGQSLAAGRYQPKSEAYRLYTLGRYHRSRWNGAGLRKAIEYFEQAVAIDPGYAAAYGLMANSWTLLGYFFGMPPREAYPKGEAIAQKALSLDDRAPEAHHAIAAIRLFFDWNFPQAEFHVRRGLELDPNNPDSLQLFGIVRTVQHKNSEGIAAMERALEVDPTSQWRHVGMTFQYACGGRMEAAIEEAKNAHELDPALAAPMLDLFNLHMVQGRHKDAVAWYLKFVDRPASGDRAAATALKEKFEKEGIQGFLRTRIARHLEQLRSGSGVGPMALAQLYTFLGERDEAVRWIEKAVEQRQSTVIFVNQHPMYASLRDQPRFREIVRRIGL